MALEMAFQSGKNGSHVGPGLSTVDIFAALYGRVLRFDKGNTFDENRDRLIVSKGHCVLSYYAALYLSGLISIDIVHNFEKNGSHFHGHAMRNLANGIEFSGGSLSMGMSFAVGEALACRKKGLNSRVYVIVGDGECDEGLIWEAAMSASHFGLNNLTVIVDENKLQYDGLTKDVMNPLDLTSKFQAFGFDTERVDGHNPDLLAAALERQTDKPRCIIADTIKGKGVSFIEGMKEWHHAVLSEEDYRKALAEVENN